MTFISVGICTYKRPNLLNLIIKDLVSQNISPNHLIIVDGDPSSGEVRQLLVSSDLHSHFQVFYVPSNHGNLAYQRYLVWCVARQVESEVLIYFDDDQRIFDVNVIKWLSSPLSSENNDIVGVGCYSRVPSEGHDPAMDHLMKQKQSNQVIRRFGSRSKLDLKPGQLTPIGHRVALIDNGEDYVETTWLQGRIMAYRMSAFSQETFSDNLFALDHIRCGLGEDTFLSRRVGAKGKLLYTFKVAVEHPNADTPKSYPYEAYKYAYAAAYSRRFQNDYFRIYESPKLQDRWYLFRSYIGNVALRWLTWILKPTNLNLALARGTTLGSVHGITRPPTAQRLTPDIDWWGDAEAALEKIVTIKNDAS